MDLKLILAHPRWFWLSPIAFLPIHLKLQILAVCILLYGNNLVCRIIQIIISLTRLVVIKVQVLRRVLFLLCKLKVVYDVHHSLEVLDRLPGGLTHWVTLPFDKVFSSAIL